MPADSPRPGSNSQHPPARQSSLLHISAPLLQDLSSPYSSPPPHGDVNGANPTTSNGFSISDLGMPFESPDHSQEDLSGGFNYLQIPPYLPLDRDQERPRHSQGRAQYQQHQQYQPHQQGAPSHPGHLSVAHGSSYAEGVPPLPPLRSLNRGTVSGAGALLRPFPSPAPPLLPAAASPSTTAPPAPPSSSTRQAVTWTANWLQRPAGWRTPRRRPSTLNSVISSLDEIGQHLDDANSHLRALLDLPPEDELLGRLPSLPSELSPSLTPNMASRASGGAGSRRESSRSEENSRLAKRRKLDFDRSTSPAFRGFRYGRYGQVEPGTLTMEIVSCDGGLYSDGTSYAAENILKSDNSVYCTKGNRCNIVLQHQGSTTFSLKELIIKAPGRNYSSPVREGMVFLSMTKDELLRTEQYQSNVAIPSTHLRRSLGDDGAAGHRQLPAPTSFGYNIHSDEISGDLYNFMNELEEGQSPPLPQATVVSNPTFHVTTECSDDEDEVGRAGLASRGGWRNAAGWSPTPLRNSQPQRRPGYDEPSSFGNRMLSWGVGPNAGGEDPEDEEDEDEDDDEYDYAEANGVAGADMSSPDSFRDAIDRGADGQNQDSREGRSRDMTAWGRDSRQESLGLTQLPSLSGIQTDVTRAKFHIEKSKSKCTIHFDPPITARYILLKMWNPRQDMGGNIDIQGVVARGFAGPRYFPALELR